MEAQSHTICEYIDLMRAGQLGSEELTAHYLNAIEQSDGDIHAWIHRDDEGALNQARHWDDRRKRGLPLGRLHGMPVGVKDIFDTADFPTECGSMICQGRQPERDSAAVERLKEVGLVLVVVLVVLFIIQVFLLRMVHMQSPLEVVEYLFK